ncbi:MAG: hypothetical protein JNL81_01200 [Hyphomonadaceae bacterium]|nr:hypothetical protein [Hyphomonadaceae bacterium]
MLTLGENATRVAFASRKSRVERSQSTLDKRRRSASTRKLSDTSVHRSSRGAIIARMAHASPNRVILQNALRIQFAWLGNFDYSYVARQSLFPVAQNLAAELAGTGHDGLRYPQDRLKIVRNLTE